MSRKEVFLCGWVALFLSVSLIIIDTEVRRLHVDLTKIQIVELHRYQTELQAYGLTVSQQGTNRP